ncbi:small RNA 2'-O-methyltransferase-like [Littorina saxatilis]|uniref:small RNA 2'-O-methyltransferase-like n=1 Tax=Littorina saxatilis TaxID=31220 RepID=UPI0038B5EEC0
MLAVAYLWYLLSSKKPVTPVAVHEETVAEFEEKKVYKPLAYNALPQQEGDPEKYPAFNHCESVGGKTDLSELSEAQNNQMHHTMHYESSVTQHVTGCSDHVDHQLQKETTELPGLEMRSSGDSVHDQTQENTTGKNHGEEESVSGGPKFSPPVYIQRYKLVKKIMQEHTIESMVDFGSNDCKITRWLKDVETLTNLSLVDIDGETLRSSINMVKPLNCEFIIRRQYPLTVKVLEGNAGELDGRVAGCQAASLVEVVEHLEPDVLKQVTHCVFGRLRPPLVVVTTPNADFNILFPNFTGFRHWDHKFEWTREEFHHWCECICTQHGYSVSYTGVGDAPVGMSHLGFCSQVGIFTKVSGKPGESTDEEVYKLVSERLCHMCGVCVCVCVNS